MSIDIQYSAELIGEKMGIPFDEEQRAAISAPFEPNVIIAGAGAGKTSVMAARVVYLVANGFVKVDEVLGLTFTTLATSSLQKKIREALGLLLGSEAHDEDFGEPTVSTYHSFAQSILKEHALRIGIEPDSNVIADARANQLATFVVQRTKVSLADSDMTFRTVVNRVLELDSSLSDYDITIDEATAFNNRVIAGLEGFSKNETTRKIPDVAKKRNLLLQIVDEFRDNKRSTDNIDYADMTRFGLKIAREFPEIVSDYRERFKLVMLDEYQDTSVSQRKLMRILFGDGHPVTAVGDPLQSIYSFRGASPYNIEDFATHFPRKDGTPSQVLTISTTRRNGPNIVALANRVSELLRTEVAHPNLRPLKAGEPAQYGIGEVDVTCHLTSDDEVAWLVEKIQSARAEGTPLEEIAMLLQRNDDVAWFYRKLTEHGITAQVRTKQDLLNIPEIAEVVSYLRVIAEPAANSDWVRILTGPRWRIGNRDLALIGRHAAELAKVERPQGRDLESAMAAAVASTDSVDIVAYGDALDDIVRNGLGDLSTEAHARIKVLVAEIGQFRCATSDDLVDLVYRVAAGTGLLSESRAHTERVKLGLAINLRQFFNLVADFRALDGSASIFSLLRFFDEAQKFDKNPTIEMALQKGAVQLITVHQSKGLEFSAVALPRFAENIFPAKKGAESWTGSAQVIPFALRDEHFKQDILKSYPTLGANIENKETEKFDQARRLLDELDQRRLAYVAVTRAKQKLWVSTSRLIEGEDKARDVSLFLTEMRETAQTLTEKAVTTPWHELTSDQELAPEVVTGVWPVPLESEAMQQIRAAARRVYHHIAESTPVAASTDDLIHGWDVAINALERELKEVADCERTIVLPRGLSVTEVQRLAKDEKAFIENLVRPMPQEPAPAAAQGTTFHAWVEQRARTMQGVGAMPTLPGMEEFDDDLVIALDTANLKKFQSNFESSEWASRVPSAVEHPFTVSIAGRLIRGKIDAVYQDGDKWILVDWKTNSKADADPLQLSIYRVAWADEFGIDLGSISAAFYYAALNQTVHADNLLTREEIAGLLS